MTTLHPVTVTLTPAQVRWITIALKFRADHLGREMEWSPTLKGVHQGHLSLERQMRAAMLEPHEPHDPGEPREFAHNGDGRGS